MKASKGEIKISEILDMNDLDYKEEYVFPDLIASSGRPLRFDFAVFDDEGNLDFLIEYQGEQHYTAKSKFGGRKGLQKQQYNDKRKKVYCAQHGYTLICIPYWEYSLIDYDYIMEAAGY